MMQRGNYGYWLLAGAMLGAAGVYMGLGRGKNAAAAMKKMRYQAARAASRAGHGAGEFMCSVGDSLAEKLR